MLGIKTDYYFTSIISDTALFSSIRRLEIEPAEANKCIFLQKSEKLLLKEFGIFRNMLKLK
jgi:hypothetical protein